MASRIKLQPRNCLFLKCLDEQPEFVVPAPEAWMDVVSTGTLGPPAPQCPHARSVMRTAATKRPRLHIHTHAAICAAPPSPCVLISLSRGRRRQQGNHHGPRHRCNNGNELWGSGQHQELPHSDVTERSTACPLKAGRNTPRLSASSHSQTGRERFRRKRSTKDETTWLSERYARATAQYQCHCASCTSWPTCRPMQRSACWL